MHSLHIAHCDIKEDNILVDADGHLLLCDYGLSKRLTSGDRKFKTDWQHFSEFIVRIFKNDELLTDIIDILKDMDASKLPGMNRFPMI